MPDGKKAFSFPEIIGGFDSEKKRSTLSIKGEDRKFGMYTSVSSPSISKVLSTEVALACEYVSRLWTDLAIDAAKLQTSVPIAELQETMSPPAVPLKLTAEKKKLHTCEFDRQTLGGEKFQPTGGAFDNEERIPDVVGALCGWRSWNWDPDTEQLVSMNSPSRTKFWIPGEAQEALCVTPHKCPEPPCRNCGCGLYAAKAVEHAYRSNVIGRVWLWGRFFEGERGYRAQFAYPRDFHIFPRANSTYGPASQDALKKYGVPIYEYAPIPYWEPDEETKLHP